MTKPIDFLSEISDFIFTSKYARFNEKLGRRETWNECVHRVEKMHLDKFKKLSDSDISEIKWAFELVLQKHIVPSMRSMQFGGKAVVSHNARIYNCAVRHVDSSRAFAEIFYLLLCGCGVGAGLFKKFLDRLPDLVGPKDKNGTVITYVVQDSIEGWADSIEALLNCYFRNTAFSGRKIVFDYSKIRPEGAPLKMAGGKAPGYKGLKKCHKKVKELLDHIIEEFGQVRMKSINAGDIILHCADAVLSGGIRRSAVSFIFDKDDEDMMNAKVYFKATKYQHFEKNEKTGKWEGIVFVDGLYGGFAGKKYEVAISEWEYEEMLKKEKKISWLHIEPQRARSNNSVLLIRNQTTKEEFLAINKITQQFGEPGFVFSNSADQLFNPCFEIGFEPVTVDLVCGVQFCNLTSMNGAYIDTIQKFKDAVKGATIIGTLQASYDNFGYLSHIAKKLTTEEALLGVSITGVYDNPKILLDPKIQREMAEYATEINKEWAAKLGIKPAARITCIKPEGTSSLVLKSGSGIHPHHARRYFRRVQCNKHDNVYKFFKSKNPHMCEPSIWSENKTDDVIAFPLTISDTAMVKSDLTALKHLSDIKSTQLNWVLPGTTSNNKKDVTHNVSCTVNVKPDEWEAVFDYLYENRAHFSAVSLLSVFGDKDYKQAPMEAITTPEDEVIWKNYVDNYTPVNYKELKEEEDNTKLSETASCAGGSCELVQL